MWSNKVAMDALDDFAFASMTLIYYEHLFFEFSNLRSIFNPQVNSQP